MIKAEIIEHEGYPLPNWVLKCKAVITSGPALTVLTLIVAVMAGLVYWQDRRPAYSDVTKTVEPAASQLQVKPTSSNTLPAEAQSPLQQPVSTPASGSSAGAGTSSTVGPAPTDSLQNLQPGTTTSPEVNPAGSLTSGLTQTTQAAGTIPASLLNSLGL